MKVSIVTISYNQAEFLRRTIDSVLNQDYKDIEYIIVDPGSKDGSRELIESYRSRIALAVLEPDQGPSDGLNKGFAFSTGEILAFLNSDDVLFPGAVSAAVRLFSQHPEVDVVSGHAKILDSDERVLRRTYSDRMSAVKYVYGGVTLIQPSTFFRRTAFQRVSGFNVNNHICWDGELFFDMAMAGCKFVRSDEIWSGYRLHSGTITLSTDLVEKRRELDAMMFHRVFGRKMNRMDQAMCQIVRFWKHLMNPRDSIQRILEGPIAGRQTQ
jgi:glycosyltransferase involved in cell wall biosynthesis